MPTGREYPIYIPHKGGNPSAMKKLHYDIDIFYSYLAHFTTKILPLPNQDSITVQVTVEDLDITSDEFLPLLHKSLFNYLTLLTNPANYLLTSEQQLEYNTYYKSLKSAKHIDVSIILLNVTVSSGVSLPHLILTRDTIFDKQDLKSFPIRNIALHLNNSLLINCIFQGITSLHLINHSNCNLYVEDSDIPLTEIILDNSSLTYTSPYLLSHTDNTHQHETYAYLCTTLKSSMNMILEQIFSSTSPSTPQPLEQEDKHITPWEALALQTPEPTSSTSTQTINNLRNNLKGKELIRTISYRKPCTIKISLINSELLALHTQEGIIAYFDGSNTIINLIADVQDRKDNAVQPIAEEYTKQDTQILSSMIYSNIDKIYDLESSAVNYINTIIGDINTDENMRSNQWLANLLTNLPDTIKSTIPQNILISGTLQSYINSVLSV